MARPKRQEARRDELVAAAQRAIVKNGPDGARLNRVAAEAGMTAGAVLYYYPDVEELILEANRVGMERFYDERMRMIDADYNWAPKTLSSYRPRIGFLRHFESDFGCVALPALRLTAPPFTSAIPLMWAMQHYTLQVPRGSHPASGERISFNTSRALRSAAAFYHEGRMVLQHPASALRDPVSKRGRLAKGRSPTDHLGFTQMATGMSRHLGTATVPAKALRHEHIVWNQRFHNCQYRRAQDPTLRYEIAASAVCSDYCEVS